GTFVFDLLCFACGFYLAWIGGSAVNARPKAEGQALVVVERPFRRGRIFGVTNPKGYPVALANFTALVAGSAGALDF
ncbi:LysE family translocator, partial [Rhizobium ruizarguesonis]